MGKVLKIVTLLAIPAILFASGDNAAAEQYFKITGRHTDFVPRLFNFILLAGLLYYLLANPIKNFLKNRTDSIAKELEEIEAKRQQAKNSKIKAEELLKEAKTKAIDIIEDAKKEAEIIKANIKKHAQQEVVALEKIFNDKCEIERRKVLRETTVNVLDENISTNDIPLDANKIVQIVTKEVA